MHPFVINYVYHVGVIMKYSVLAYNLNNYEAFRDLYDDAVDPNVEYIYVTDNPQIRSKKWKVIYDSSLNGKTTFDKCYSVRFNLFKYATNDICVYIDGSIVVKKPITPMVDRFLSSNADLAIMVHPDRTTMWSEYMKWVEIRGYPKDQAFKCLAFMSLSQYDVMNYRGLYQGGMRITRRTPQCMALDKDTYTMLMALRTATDIERNDQTVWSYLLNTKYTDLTLYPFTQSWIQSSYLSIHRHGVLDLIPYHKHNTRCMNYVRNVEVDCDVESSKQMES